MTNYELTERGKIIIAVILVLLLLVLPSTILVVLAWDNTPPPVNDPPQTSEPEPDPDSDSSVISDRPLPDGSGFNPDDTTLNENGESGSFDPAPELPGDVPVYMPVYGPVSIDRNEGTMLFLFAPGIQDTLDDKTVSMLGEFVTSPKNTIDTVILIEIPLLPEEDTNTLISAIAEAFAKHGVSQSELAYIVYQTDTDEDAYVVTLSFYDDPSRK